MNPDIKAKWLAALKGGKYEQGRQVLRSGDDKYCCLGVLCDLTGVTWTPHSEGARFYANGLGVMPSRDMYASWGMDPESGSYLADRNDDGWTFRRIADYIEDHL